MLPHTKTTYSDEEELLEEVTTSGEGCHGNDGFPNYNGNRSRRPVAYILGGIALVACAAVSFVTVAPSKADGEMTAMQIFDSPRIHEVATNNIMHVGERLIGEKMRGYKGPVRRLVERGFKNATAHLRKFYPDDARLLDNTRFTKAHEESIAHVLGYAADDRTTRIGLKIAHAVRDSKPDATDDELKNQVAHALLPHMHELMGLHMEMYPKDSPLRALVARGGSSQRSMDRKRIKMLQIKNMDPWDKLYQVEDEESANIDRHLQGVYANPSSFGSTNTGSAYGPRGAAFPDNGPDFGVGIQATDAPEGITENTLGLLGAVTEEMRTVLDLSRGLSKETGNDLNVDPDITTGIGAADFAMEFGACEADAAADDFNPLELAACPIEFSSQGMDASRDLFTYLGLLGDNNPANGVQGNHAGQNTHNAKLGLLDDLGWVDQEDIDDMDPFQSNDSATDVLGGLR